MMVAGVCTIFEIIALFSITHGIVVMWLLRRKCNFSFYTWPDACHTGSFCGYCYCCRFCFIPFETKYYANYTGVHLINYCNGVAVAAAFACRLEFFSCSVFVWQRFYASINFIDDLTIKYILGQKRSTFFLLSNINGTCSTREP